MRQGAHASMPARASLSASGLRRKMTLSATNRRVVLWRASTTCANAPSPAGALPLLRLSRRDGDMLVAYGARAGVGGLGLGLHMQAVASSQPPILTKIHNDLVVLADWVIAPHHPVLQHGCAIEAHAPYSEVLARINLCCACQCCMILLFGMLAAAATSMVPCCVSLAKKRT